MAMSTVIQQAAPIQNPRRIKKIFHVSHQIVKLIAPFPVHEGSHGPPRTVFGLEGTVKRKNKRCRTVDERAESLHFLRFGKTQRDGTVKIAVQGMTVYTATIETEILKYGYKTMTGLRQTFNRDTVVLHIGVFGWQTCTGHGGKKRSSYIPEPLALLMAGHESELCTGMMNFK